MRKQEGRVMENEASLYLRYWFAFVMSLMLLYVIAGHELLCDYLERRKKKSQKEDKKLDENNKRKEKL